MHQTKTALATGVAKNHGSGSGAEMPGMSVSVTQSSAAARHWTHCGHPDSKTCLPLDQCYGRQRKKKSVKFSHEREKKDGTYYDGLLVSMYAFDGL